MSSAYCVLYMLLSDSGSGFLKPAEGFPPQFGVLYFEAPW